MEPLTWVDVLTRLGVAALCGAVIGWERGASQHPAGLRTQLLISIGAAGFVLMAVRWTPPATNLDIYELDPMRVLQGIAQGVGLLAGGAIIQAGGSVKGFTTASSVWAVAAVGASAGFGDFVIAGILTGMTILATGVLVYIDPKEREEAEREKAARQEATRNILGDK